MTIPYCSQNDLLNRLSADGVNYRIDDNPPVALGDVIIDASSQIDEHLFFLYDPTQLVQSDWVRERCADIAAYLLCERRGNPVPPGIEAKFVRTMDRLEKVRCGQLAVPNLPVLKSLAPVLSNVRIQMWPWPRVVVEPSNSTGTPAGYPQSQDILDYGYDFCI